MIAVLGDEAPALAVDDDPGQQRGRRVAGRGDEGLVHVQRLAPGRQAKLDPEAVIVGGAEHERLLRQLRDVLRHQLGVHDEAARREDDAAGQRDTGLGERPPPHPGHPAVIEHQLGDAGLVPDADAKLCCAAHQQVDDEPGALRITGNGDLVTARSWDGQLAKGPDLLVPGVHQALGLRLDDRLVGVVAALELESQALEPVAMPGAAVRVCPDLGWLRLRSDGHEVGVHLVGAVGVARGVLHDSAAAEVEVAARHGARAARDRRPLQDQHRCARGRRLDRGAAAGDAEADHEDVDLIRHRCPVPAVNAHGSAAGTRYASGWLPHLLRRGSQPRGHCAVAGG